MEHNMVIKGTEAFEDADTVKADSMFEDIPLQSDDQGGEDGMGEDATTNSPVGDPSDYDAIVNGTGSEEVPADGDVPPVEGTTEGTDNDLSSPEEIQAFLDSLSAATDASADAAKGVEDAAKTGDSAKIEQSIEDWQNAVAEKDRVIEQITRKLEMEKANSDKLLEDKFMLEADAKESNKIADVVVNDDSLKALVAYKSKSSTSETYKTKYIDQLQQMYEDATGVSIEDLLTLKKQNEKSGMGGSSYSFEGNQPESKGDMGGMFEDVPLK